MLTNDRTISGDGRTYTAIALLVMLTGLAIRYRIMPLVNALKEKGLGEGFNVARSYAQTGNIADAFQIGQGPTAHLMPLPGVIAGTVYRYFGILSPASNLILTTIALFFVFTSFWLIFQSFRELESPRLARLLGLAIVCLSPINVMIEDVWFRVWDGGMAVAFGAMTLYILLRIDRSKVISRRHIVALSALAAATLFVSPPFGVAAYVCAAILMVRRQPVGRWLSTAAIALVVAGVILAPWTVRNVVVMGKPVILRDNFGLELAQANDPALVNSTDPDGGVKRQHELIHPWASRAAYSKMVAAGGEIAYSQQLKVKAVDWITSHPRDFLILTARHLRVMTFPPVRSSNERSLTLFSLLHRVLIYWVVSGLGFAGIAYALLRLNHRYQYAAVMTLAPILPYLVVEANLRYRYLIFTLIAFFAADFSVRLLTPWLGGEHRSDCH